MRRCSARCWRRRCAWPRRCCCARWPGCCPSVPASSTSAWKARCSSPPLPPARPARSAAPPPWRWARPWRVTVALSWLHGLACVSHRGDQVVSGVAVNIIAAGLTVVLGIAWFAAGRADAAGRAPAVRARRRCGRGAAALRSARSSATACSATTSWSTWRWRWCRRCGGCCTARASACGCARWARTRRWSMPPACRCRACVMPR